MFRITFYNNAEIRSFDDVIPAGFTVSLCREKALNSRIHQNYWIINMFEKFLQNSDSVGIKNTKNRPTDNRQ